MSTSPVVRYYWVTESRRVAMPSKPLRVQTVMGGPGQDQTKTPEIAQAVHLGNVFIEDYVHDWNWDSANSTLVYYSRIIFANTWIRCEFAS